MKYLVRVFLFNVFGLWLSSELLPFFQVQGPWQTLLASGLTLSLLMLVVQPILKILFIPINIITFGLLSWLTNVIVLFLLTVFMAQVSVTSWTFPGYSENGFSLPSAPISYPFALILSSLTVTFIANLLHDVSES